MTPPPANPQSPATNPKTTVVAGGTKVKGEVSGSASLVVEGVVEGRLHLENEVSVGVDGLVTGEIKARSVRVGGRVKGNIEGLEMIEILAKGSVEGDVRSPRVVIADGAFFKGKVEMGGDEKDSLPVQKQFE
jgi:cytoskeletal protein CcmA (bactofilin family)